ncbi:Kelch-like protein 4 [Saguinus oedipus]|uniref:Kelch-like protein 4 n=1 Tax=Saguinus oedipus TaxID=9490 RepID=A0ABQ9TFK2_SAGOE|nr:Kelch-like protein 4 [Saguinus oedipus]
MNTRSEEQFHVINHAEQTLRKMENYLKEKQLCDVLLIAGHLRIPAHRQVFLGIQNGFRVGQLEIRDKELNLEKISDGKYSTNTPSKQDQLVLSAVSDYFAAMFTNDVLEAKQEEVRMEGVDPNALNSLVQYAYTVSSVVAILLLLLYR